MNGVNIVKNIVENFGNIRRNETNFSQEQIAEKMGKSQSAYARIERGATKIDLATLVSFSQSVNMSIIDVIAYPKKLTIKDEHENAEMILQVIKKGDALEIKIRDKELEMLKLI